MAAKQTPKARHVPQRTCVGCREVLAKRSLIRLVRTADGVRVDPSGKMAGRGAYLHDQKSCWEKALKGPLKAALKTEISAEDMAVLKEIMNNLPSAGPNPAEEGISRGEKM